VPSNVAFSDDTAREIADALNVKMLEPVTDLEGLLDYAVLPNFRSLGPKVGKRMPLVKDALLAADGGTVSRALSNQGTYELQLADGSSVDLGPDDVEVRARSHEELVLAEDAGYAVALDTTVDDELRAEGIARDLVRAINDRRRELGFQIADRIRLRVLAAGRIGAAAHRYRDWIAREVLAVELDVVADAPVNAELEIDGEPVGLEISRA
jgi:isoleucyl-tRNA synthetase